MILTVYPTVLQWGTRYLDFSQAQHVKKTYEEKRDAFQRFISAVGDIDVSSVSAAKAMEYLQMHNKTRSGYSTNKERKNLSAAWEWGRKYIDGFPMDTANPFQAVDKFPEIRQPRYVPPIEDLDQVLAVVEGQDHVMLMAFLHLAARRGELFRLTWKDVDFTNGRVCLTTKKTRSSSTKRVWLPMSSELRKGLKWWWENRLHKAGHVFIMTENTPTPGEPFKQRRHFMKRICQKAGVKPFGFHAIRHIAAGYLYKIGKPLSLIQRILRHESPSTTERYLKNLGFIAEDLGDAVEEFVNRGQGKVVPFPEKKITPRAAISEG